MARRVDKVVFDGRWTREPAPVPVVGWDGSSGSTLVITANVHGDELTGTAAVHLLDAMLHHLPLRGRVLLYPTLNPEGLAARSRLVPEDGVDLNRVFPGRPGGSRGGRAAHAIWKNIAANQPEILIDLHADAQAAVPYVIVDRPIRLEGEARARFGARLERLAEASGLSVLREYTDDPYVRFGLDRSLAGAAVNVLGIAALTIEVGPRNRVDPEAVDVVVRAVLGVMAELGMVPRQDPPAVVPVVPGPWRRAPAPRARREGLCVPERAPGSSFMKGERLARIVDVLGATVDEIAASEPGLVVSWADGGWVQEGAVVGTLAVRDPGGL
jgi:predicted deacylase